MPYGMYIAAEGAQAQAQRLEVIANNMANVDTAGFKQDVPTFQARFAEAIQEGLARPHDRSINDIGGGVKLMDVATDYSEGTLKATGGELDLAIDGKGFFLVRGDFMLNIDGVLVSQNGQRPVLDQSGALIQMDPNAPFAVSQDGFITQSGNVFALGMSQPKSLDQLIKVGNNLYESLEKIEPVKLEERNIRQGFLEMSGASPVRQMLAMIETTRAFEANTRMIQNQDSMIGMLVGRLLRAS
jgi:flagellar basal-body rod protein FlgF